MKAKKPTRGGARNFIDPKKGHAKNRSLKLYDAETAYFKNKYGSLAKALRSLLPEKFWDDPLAFFGS